MQKYISILFIVFLFGGYQATAQRSEAPPARFADRLWYGGGFILGFASTGNQTQFQFGLSPMVGYKLFDGFSVGPRAALTYTHYRENFGGEVETANPLSYALAVFGRYKIVPTIFAHVEYENENAAVFTLGSNGLDVARRIRDNVYIGGGYTSGGDFATEIVLLYNVNQAENSIEQPFVFRFGFTKNF